MSFSQLIRRLFDMSKYLANSFKNIKVFFERINSNKFTTKILFCCFLSFYFKVNISVTLTIVINFYCKLNQSYNLYYVCMFSSSNELSIVFSNDCSFLKITSYCLDPNLVLIYVLMFFCNP